MAEIPFKSAYQTNNAALQENTLKTLDHPLDNAASYLFVGLPFDAATFSGNNAIGILYSFDAFGEVIAEYKGEISRQYKLPGNQVEAFQFYAYPEQGGKNYNKISSTTFLLDVGSQALTPNTSYTTSSDFKPADLNAFISKVAILVPNTIPVDATNNPLDPPGPLDEGWIPGGPDTTPDPVDGKVEFVPPSNPDKPSNVNDSELPEKEIIQINSGDGEKHILDIKDPIAPDHNLPLISDIYVSTDAGKTWEKHKPGDEITTGEKDTLVVVDTHNNPNPETRPPHDLELVIDGATDKEVNTAISPLDASAPLPGGPDTTPDPQKGVIEAIPKVPTNAGSPDAIVQLNTPDGEKLTFEVENKTSPGGLPTNLHNPEIFVSTDNGHSWDHIDPGQEIQAGKDDVLVAIDISNNPDKGTGITEGFILVINSGKQNEIDVPVTVVDDGSGTVSRPIDEKTVNYSGHDVPTAPRDMPIVGLQSYDDHGSICFL